MREAAIKAKDLETWAGFLLDHSLGGIEPADRVMIKGERICWPLMAVLERRVIQAGAVADVCLVPPNNDRGRVWSAVMGREGSAEQLARIPDWHGDRYRSMTKYVEVLGGEDPAQYAGLAPAQQQALAAADRPFADLRLSKPWVITLYPTPAFAALEGMPLGEYTRFIVRASTTDPRPLLEAEQALEQVFASAKSMTVTTRHPDRRRDFVLELGLSSGRPIMSYGLRNFPDGEIFTSPDATATEGEIFVDLPVNYGGNDIQGIYLKFEGGRIVRYRAAVGHQHLAAIIETDDGSHRLGEVALGMNPGLDRVLKHPLFVEKVGGTLHIAIGASYEGCFVDDPRSDKGAARIKRLERSGVLNRSAQHVDIVADFRPGGCGRRVRVGDVELRPANGVWVVAG
ncbi:MAG TPA: aminopeptidase [Thermoanaerobaculales bacterium]|nr:aminopeptidase [Thermoanaerobaculales bacterium]HPA81121.1 aminopeptidase [Thermoanaerobaculales bacterium]HQL30729.1 aminopeptidase [Thermoanaerobaculales bacterium]HQN95387.1 aminopeptidase [Thermoanaerobaculales bacterium]